MSWSGFNKDPYPSAVKTMELSSFDQIMVRGIVRFLLLFKVEDKKDCERSIAVLQQSLSSLVNQTRFLGGQVKTLNTPRHEVEVRFVDKPDLKLQINRPGKAIPSFKELERANYPLSALPSDVLSPCPDRMSGNSQPVFAVQANLIQGGMILCVCAHHNVVDGVGFGTVMEAFAAHCQAASTGNYANLGKYDNLKAEAIGRGKLFRDIKREEIWERRNHVYPEYHASDPLSKASSTAHPPPSTARLFVFSAENLFKLKPKISKNVPTGQFVSTADCLGALLWSSVTKARFSVGSLHSKEISNLASPVDTRRHLQGRLGFPHPFLGNAVITTLARLEVHSIINSTNLAPLALKIRMSIMRIDKSYTLGLIHHAANHTGDLNALKPAMKAFHGPDINYTSWSSFKMYDLNFGTELGKIAAFRCPWRALDGCTKVLPKRRDGAMEIVVELEEKAMKVLLVDKDWMGVVSEVVN